MARQVGALKYKGTIGDVRHFKIKGLQGNFAGLVGGPSGEQIKTAPEFKRTRENMNEFGGSATAAKSVRISLSELIKQMGDSQLTGRLTAIMKKINLEDQSEARGQRAILISQQSQYLKGLAFNKHISLDGIFLAPFTLAHAVGRDIGTLTVPAFNPANLVNAPAGATHFRLILAMACVSDFAFNAVTKAYEPIDSVNNEISNVAYSGYLDLSTATVAPTVVTATLPGSPTLPADTSVLQCIGIEFVQLVGANYYLFSSGNCLKIQEII